MTIISGMEAPLLKRHRGRGGYTAGDTRYRVRRTATATHLQSARRGPSMSRFPQRDQLLVGTDWLAEHLGDNQLRVLDCRFYFDRDSYEVYQAGHIPGAVYFNWQTALSDPNNPVDFMLAPP